MPVVVLVLLALGLSSCFWQKNDENPIRFEPGFGHSDSKNVKVPMAVADKIEAEYIEHAHGLTPYEETNKEILKQMEREYLDVHVYLTQEQPNAMKSNTNFLLPRGGGVVDLAHTITGKRGSFYVKLKLNKNIDPDSEITDVKTFFLSNSKEREIDGEKFGNGCQRYFDLSSFASKFFSEKGLRVNATDQRYVGTLAGSFYFYTFEERKLVMGTISFKDSRYPEHMCR